MFFVFNTMLNRRLHFLLQILFGQSIFVFSDWDYSNGTKGPNNWRENYPNCEGDNQSPVKLSFENLEIFDYNLKKDEEMLEFFNYDRLLENSVITNTGYSIEIDIQDEINISMTATFLPVTYNLETIIFRWESEHTLGETHYPLEVQLVHYHAHIEKTKATEFSGGVAIVSIFFQTLEEEEQEEVSEAEADAQKEAEAETVTATEDVVNQSQSERKRKRRKRDEESNSETETAEDEEKWNEDVMQLITETLPSISMLGETTSMPDFDIIHLLPKEHESVIHYSGSMTVPPCNEVVDWLIFTNVGIMTEAQLNAFKNIALNYSNPSIGSTGNFRPIQKLNKRRLELRSSKIANINQSTELNSNCIQFMFMTFLVIVYNLRLC